MYRLLPVILLYAFFSSSCASKKDKSSFSSLRVVVPLSQSLFIDSVFFTNTKTSDTLTALVERDSLVSDPRYVHDSVPTGPVTINFISRFHRIHTVDVQLEHDSTIKLEPEELSALEETDSSDLRLADLASGKEILIQADFPGMLGEAKHEIRIKKEGAQYKLVFNSRSETMQGVKRKPQVERVLDPSFAITFDKLRESCNTLNTTSVFWCDHGVTVYIVYENTLFTCHDPCTSWKGYDDFLKALNLTSN